MPFESLALPAAVREWYLLADRWSQGALNVWIGPQELAAEAGMVEVLTDTQGVNRWEFGLRITTSRIRLSTIWTSIPPKSTSLVACTT